MFKLEIGTVVSTMDGPSPSKFAFVVKENGSSVKRGQFIQLQTAEGIMIGRISDVLKANRYFERVESVREYERKGESMESIFPVGRWEFTVSEVKPLGVYHEGDKRLLKPSFPPSPGTKVNLADDKLLEQFLGLEADGIDFGTIEHHNVEVKLNMTKLLQKHLAILAMSGAGKSYLTAVLIEELLNRKKEMGRVGIVLFDVHGEYTSFAEPVSPGKDATDYSKYSKIINGSNIKIGVSNLSSEQLSYFMTGLSLPQKRELGRIFSKIKKKHSSAGGTFNLIDIIKAIEKDDKIKTNSKDPLISWLFDLNKTGLFGDVDYPAIKSFVKPGNMSIIDLGNIINNKSKQLIVNYIVHKLFTYRRESQVPPFLLVLEEAHQFVPEGSAEHALSRKIIETIAREGRKFHASLCLISQRPVRLSTTVLSQCNTHIIMRVTNPYDLKHIGESSEGISSDTLDAISSLPVGEGLIVGAAVNYPIFVKIRERNSQESSKAMTLEKAAIDFEGKKDKKEKDAESLMEN